VVQPGAEFGNDFVIDYDRPKAADISRMIESHPGMTLEAHSTDYQKREALREMVEDNFTILKVGPWLTYALREGVFALAGIEKELLGASSGGRTPSGIEETLEAAMQANPDYWRKYYPGSPGEQLLQRRYSYSDRVRYYWQRPEVETALERLFSNLKLTGIPLSLLSQFLPGQYEAVREGRLGTDPSDLARDKIREVLRVYSYACN